MAAFDKIEDLICPKYLDYLSQKFEERQGKLEVTYILSKPPPTWRSYSGSIDEVLLYDWIRENYSTPPPAIPPKISNYGGSNFTSNLTHGIQNMQNMSAHNYLNQNNYNVTNNPVQEDNENSKHEQQNNVPLTPKNRPTPIQIPHNYNSIDRQYNQNSPSYSSSPYSSSSSPLNNNPAILLMNERHNYMSLFAKDNSKQVKLVVCGSNHFNKNIRKNLEKIVFPIDEKALFIE